MDFPDNIKTLLDAGVASADAKMIDNDAKPYVIVPEGCKVEDLERLLYAPTRKRAAVTATQPASFVEYIKVHGHEERTTIYADVDSENSRCVLTAILNDHRLDDSLAMAGWRDHTCSFEPKKAVEWTRWLGMNRKEMNQSAFATWLEDNLGDVAPAEGMPNGAQMLEMALNFERTADKRLKSRINLQSGGQRLEFIDDEDKDTRTSMQLFERFTLGLPVFDGATEAYPLEARLKYREKDGRLTFWYELIRPDRVFKTAVASIIEQVKEATGFMLIYGAAK